MIADWKAVRERILLVAERDSTLLHDPTVMEVLVDLADAAPVEFAHLRKALKAMRVSTTDVERAMKQHRYKKPPPPRTSDGPAGNTARLEVCYDQQRLMCGILGHVLVHPDVYVQGGALVRVVHQVGRRTPIARRYALPSMHALITSVVTLVEISESRNGPTEKPVEPSRLIVETLLADGAFLGARPLRGITGGPILHSDGTVVSQPGYDPVSGYYCAYGGPPVVAMDTPSMDDARTALATLTDLVSDFPFEKPCHRSSWLAAVLTLLLRPIIQEPVPFFLIDANSAGSGKTMLADLVNFIVQGEALPRRPYTDDDRELTATITAILAEGTIAALFDNVDRVFGGKMIDLVATGVRVMCRRYGVNDQSLDLDAYTVFFVTGNNITARGDLARRVMVVRLNAKEERPETRTEFRYPKLLQTAQARRGQLLGALVTLVRAYIGAGKPRAEVPSLGSFEVWSEWVRDLLLWLGEADPVESQTSMREEQNAPLTALLDAWEKVFGLNKAATITEALAVIERVDLELKDAARSGTSSSSAINMFNRNEAQDRAIPAKELEGALKELGMLSLAGANAVALGKRFKQFAQKPCNGRMFVNITRQNTNAWMVVAADGSGDAVAPAKPANDNVRRRAR